MLLAPLELLEELEVREVAVIVLEVVVVTLAEHVSRRSDTSSRSPMVFFRICIFTFPLCYNADAI